MPAKDVTTVSDTTKDVVAQPISRVDLASVTTFDQAVALAESAYGEIISSEELGDGYTVVEKSSLLNVPFLILSWEEGKNVKFENDGKPAGFTIVRGVTQNNDKVLFVDGSTGIRDQLTVFQQVSGRSGGLLAKFGLRVSEYEYTDAKGKKIPAKTYYIAETVKA